MVWSSIFAPGRIGRNLGVLGGGVLCVSLACAEAEAPGEALTLFDTERSSFAAGPPFQDSWARRASRELARGPQAARAGWAIVELPAQAATPGPRQRSRHALSMPSESPRMMLRAIGIDATACATRFRMPTKIKRDVESGTSVQINAHLGLACSF